MTELVEIKIQQGPSRTGKTQRAEAWRLEAPENRRVVEGSWLEAEDLMNEGYEVMLNVLPDSNPLLPSELYNWEKN